MYGSDKQPQQQSLLDGWRGVDNLMDWAVSVLNRPVALPLRNLGTIGEKFAGLPALLSCVVLTAFGGQSPRAYAVFELLLGLHMLLMLLHPAARKARRRKGYPTQHSQYVGVSRLAFIRGNRFALGVAEPLLCVVLGLALFDWCQPLGAYLMLGGFCLRMEIDRARRAEEIVDRELRDSYLDQQYLAERFNHWKEREGHE